VDDARLRDRREARDAVRLLHEGVGEAVGVDLVAVAGPAHRELAARRQRE
jgi:hypothetical protein